MINNKVTLLDVSFWQDNDYTPYKIDFHKAWVNGIDGVILRAGQNAWVDEDYLDYCKNADLANLPRGAYWFYDSRLSPVPQADVFADAVELSGVPALGVWGDYEENYGGRYGGEENFKLFMDRLRERFPNKIVGVYTGPDYWRNHTSATGRAYFLKFPLWIANYRVLNPDIPAPWTNFLFWQYTDQGEGEKFGAESREVDMNIFRGTIEDYKTYFLLGEYEPAPEQPSQGDKMYNCKVKSTAIPYVNLRENPGGNDIGDVYPNTEFTADRLENGWLHSVTDGMIGWVSASFCDYTEITQTPAHKLEVFVDGVLKYTEEF